MDLDRARHYNRAMMEITIPLSGLADTERLARCLAASLPADAVCLLTGDLAAGKTTLVKQICGAWGIDPRIVISPTYTIANWYEGARSVCHVDFYRLGSTAELESMDEGDWLNPDGVSFIEWPEIARPLLADIPCLALDLGLLPDQPEARRVRIRTEGPGYEGVLTALQQAFP